MASKYKWKRGESLDQGGQGHAFLAYREDDATRKPFVQKRLKNVQRIDRFRKEIEACQKLSHPNILAIEDFDLEGNEPFLISCYCERGSLRKAWNAFEDLEGALRIFSKVCNGMNHAHKQGVIHRDLKPENIFLQADGSTPVVGDFGICFAGDDGHRLTLTEEVMGPRFYTAPELEAGLVNDVQPNCDVYSLGKLLYWLVTGRNLPREDQRKPQWDIARKHQDLCHQLVVELIDKMVIEDPQARLKDASIVSTEVETLIKRVSMKAHVVDVKAIHPCDFCGLGNYQIKASGADNDAIDVAERIGFRRIGANWVIMICDHCGHLQLFRPDFAKDSKVWKNA